MCHTCPGLTRQKVIAVKGDITRLIDAATAHQAERLVVDEPNRLKTYAIEVDVIKKLKLAKRMAKAMVPEELQARAAE